MASKKNNPLLPVYLISGEDELKRETVVKRLRKRISTYGDLAFNSDVFAGEKATGEEIVAAANTLPVCERSTPCSGEQRRQATQS